MFFQKKKKINSEEAAAIYLDNLYKVIENTWPIDLETINEIYPNYSLLPNAPYVKVDLFLCIVSLELQVLSNKHPQQRIQIDQAIFKELRNNYSNGEQCVKIIVEDYLPEIDYAVRMSLSPIDAAIHIFSGRLNLDIDVNVDLLKKTAITQLIVTKIGIWKKIFETYNVK